MEDQDWGSVIDLRARAPVDAKIRHRHTHPSSPLLMLCPIEAKASEVAMREMKFYCPLCKDDLPLERAFAGAEESRRWTSCLNSSGEWLILFDDDSNLHMLNPVTGHHRPLPPLSSFRCVETQYADDGGGRITSYRLLCPLRPPPVRPQEAGPTYFTKAVVGFSRRIANSPQSSTCTVMVIHRGNCLELAFTRLGDEVWTHIAQIWSPIQDIMYLHGRFYSLFFNGAVVEYNLDGDSPKIKKISKKLDMPPHCSRNYLAHSPEGKIYQLVKLNDPTVKFDKTQQFTAYELRDRKWVQTNDLGSCCLFVGNNQVIAFRGCEDEIFFTDDHIIQKYLPPPEYHDAGIFKLQYGHLESFYPDHYQVTCPRPSWFMPASSSESVARYLMGGIISPGEKLSEPEEDIDKAAQQKRKRTGKGKKREPGEIQRRCITMKRVAKTVEEKGSAGKKRSGSQVG